MSCQSCKDKPLAPPNEKGDVYIKCSSCGGPLCVHNDIEGVIEALESSFEECEQMPTVTNETAVTRNRRSNQLNKAYFAWLGEIAHELNNNGITLQDVVKQMKALEVVPTKDNLHEILAKPYIEAQYQKTSSTKLDTKEFNQLIDALSLFFAHYYELDIPFSPDMHHLVQHYR